MHDFAHKKQYKQKREQEVRNNFKRYMQNIVSKEASGAVNKTRDEEFFYRI